MSVDINRARSTTLSLRSHDTVSTQTPKSLNFPGQSQSPSFTQKKPNGDIQEKDTKLPKYEDNEEEDEMFVMTNLPGYIIRILRKHQIMNFTDIKDVVSDVYDRLRRPDGSKYTGNMVYSIRGCLTSNKMFKTLDGNQWTLNEKLAKRYERNVLSRAKYLRTKKNKKKNNISNKKAATLDDPDDEDSYDSENPGEDDNDGYDEDGEEDDGEYDDDDEYGTKSKFPKSKKTKPKMENKKKSPIPIKALPITSNGCYNILQKRARPQDNEPKIEALLNHNFPIKKIKTDQEKKIIKIQQFKGLDHKD